MGNDRQRRFSHVERATPKSPSAAARQDAGAWARLATLIALISLTGCATTPRPQIERPRHFPAEGVITQRGVLTVFGGKQFTLNGYLARSATHGQRLVLTENFGNVLADVLVKPDGRAYVMRASPAFKPEWIERYIAADVRGLFGPGPEEDCPGQVIGPNHYRIERRWYELDLHIVGIRPGAQPAEMFAIPERAQP